MSGTVFDIQRFSIHDGPGIRTAVFLKGCGMRCLWCHNPEGLSPHRQLRYEDGACIGCGACAAACPSGAHRMDGGHTVDWALCTACGQCGEVCPAGALNMVGKLMTAAEVIDQVRRDAAFYQTSGGGMTLSGGEPLFQPSFALELAGAARDEGIRVCMETAGFCAPEALDAVRPYVELFLFDYKCPPERYEGLTGVPFGPVGRSLERLEETGAAVWLRCPVIPGVNDNAEHAAGIAGLASRLSCIRAVFLMPYHPLGISKAKKIGRPLPFQETAFMDKAAAEQFRRLVERAGCTVRISVA